MKQAYAALALATFALAACGKAQLAPVPEIDAPISPGTPTMILVPVDAIPSSTPASPLAPATPVVEPPRDDTGATTVPDLAGPAGDLGGGGGGRSEGVTDPDADEDDEDDDAL